MQSAKSISYGVAVLGASFGLAACGSSQPGSSDPATAKRADAVRFAQCMRSHGVSNFPDPGSNGHGGLEIQQSQRSGSGQSLSVNGVAISSPAFRSAMQSCRKDLPNGGHPQPLSESQKQAMLRFSQCMRAHGLTNFPDPTFGANGDIQIRFGSSSGINPRSPAFQSAQQACQSATGAGIGFKTAGPPPGG